MKLIRWFVNWKQKRYLKAKIQEAKRMHLATGKKYHVVPIVGTDRLKVVDNEFIKHYNKFVKSPVNGIDLIKLSIYSTKCDGLEAKIHKLKI